MSKTGKNTKTQVCQGCLSSDRRLSPLGVHTKLLCRVLGDDTRIARTARNNISKPKQRLCWECHQMLLNVYKFQQRVLQAQSTLHLVRQNRKQGKKCGLSLSSLKVSCLENIQHYRFIAEVLDNVVTESQTKIKAQGNSTEIKEETLEENLEKKESVDVFSFNVPEQANINEHTKPQHSSDDERVKDNYSTSKENDDDTELEPKKIYIVARKSSKNKNCEQPKHSRKPVRSKQNKMRNVKFRQVECNIGNIRTKFQRVPMDCNEVNSFLERYRNSKKFMESQYKCEKCVQDFLTEELLMSHMCRHVKAKETPYECDICKTFWETQAMLDMHYKNQHMFKLECLLCGEYFLRRNLLFSHQDETHKQTFECLECGCKFGDRSSFWRHHRSLHTTFKCDNCNVTLHTKKAIIKHLRNNHRSFKCELCNKTCGTRKSYLTHNKLKHTGTPSENTYCVECNKQFLNRYQLQVHLKSTNVHRGVQSYPCSECGKEYRKALSRNYHYKFVHLQQFEHHCQICDKNFPSKPTLKCHKERMHQKVPKVKNKVCEHCGRGFETRRTLENHIRTHTGERPYSCEFCSQTFGQKIAMINHVRRIHKMPDYKFTQVNTIKN